MSISSINTNSKPMDRNRFSIPSLPLPLRLTKNKLAFLAFAAFAAFSWTYLPLKNFFQSRAISLLPTKWILPFIDWNLPLFQSLPRDKQNDPRFFQKAYKKNPQVLQCVKNHPAIAIFLQKNPKAFPNTSQAFRKNSQAIIGWLNQMEKKHLQNKDYFACVNSIEDGDTLQAVLQQFPQALAFADEKVTSNCQLIEKIHQNNPAILKYLTNSTVISVILQKNPKAFPDASQSFRKNSQAIIDWLTEMEKKDLQNKDYFACVNSIEDDDTLKGVLQQFPQALAFADAPVKRNWQVIAHVYENNPSSNCLEPLEEVFQNLLIQNYPKALTFSSIDEKITNRVELARYLYDNHQKGYLCYFTQAAILGLIGERQCGASIWKFLPKEWRQEKQFVYQACMQSRKTFAAMSADDFEIIAYAINQEEGGWPFQYLKETMKNNSTFVKELYARTKKKYIFEYLTDNCAKEVYQQLPTCFAFLKSSLQKEILFSRLQTKEGSVCPENFQIDDDFLHDLLKKALYSVLNNESLFITNLQAILPQIISLEEIASLSKELLQDYQNAIFDNDSNKEKRKLFKKIVHNDDFLNKLSGKKDKKQTIQKLKEQFTSEACWTKSLEEKG